MKDVGSTKKVKMAGRFGSRYGTKIRQRLVDVETEQRKKHKCPKCEQFRVKRLGAGLFKCRKCGAKFSGGTYTPETNVGVIISKMVQQKQFFPLMKELHETKESEEIVEEVTETKEEKSEEKKPKKERKKKSKKSDKVAEVMLADKVEEGTGEDESVEAEEDSLESEESEDSLGPEESEENSSEESEEAGDDSDV